MKMGNPISRHYFGEPLVGTDSVLSGNGVDWAKKRKVMAAFFNKRNMTNLYQRLENVISGVEMTRIQNEIGMWGGLMMGW